MTAMLKDGIDVVQKRLDSRNKNFVVSGEYKGATSKLTSECLDCGYIWLSLPSNLIKNGCPSCNKRVKWTIKSLQELLDKEGKNITIKSQESDYKNSKSKIKISCDFCDHVWETNPSYFKQTKCPICCNLKLDSEILQKRLDDKKRDIKILSEYKGYNEDLTCVCLKCSNVWNTTLPKLIYFMRGCPEIECGGGVISGYNPSKPGYLYYLRVVDAEKTYWKIGITNLGVKARFVPSDRAKISILYCHLFTDGVDAQKAERNILNLFKEYRAVGAKVLQSGNTELFTKDVLQMNHLNWGPI